MFPVVLDLRGRPCVVIGGGAVAARKVAGLLAAGADVTVVSPALGPALAALAAAGRVRHRARAHAPGDLAGQALAFAATEDGAVNAAVARDGRARGVWVNAADDPAHCDFILPAVLRRGDLVVAVGTGGRSPALARAVRDELAAALPPGYAGLVAAAAAVRVALRRRGRRAGPEAWRRGLGDRRMRRLLAEGRPAAARSRLLAGLLRDSAPTAGAPPEPAA